MKVNFMTSDNIKIVGNYFDANSSKNLILIHQFSKDKKSWGDFPSELQKNGFNVIAIDLRGHGESDLNYNKFSDLDFINMIRDIEAADKFMKSKHSGEIYLIGASIGANTSLNYAINHNVNKIVLLSPGLNFKGIKTNASKLNTESLFVASKDDNYSYGSVQELYKQTKGKKDIKLYENAGHGTNMLGQRDLPSYILTWLKR